MLVWALRGSAELAEDEPHGKAKAMLGELRGYGFIPVNDEALAGLPEDDLDNELRNGIVFIHSAP